MGPWFEYAIFTIPLVGEDQQSAIPILNQISADGWEVFEIDRFAVSPGATPGRLCRAWNVLAKKLVHPPTQVPTHKASPEELLGLPADDPTPVVKTGTDEVCATETSPVGDTPDCLTYAEPLTSPVGLLGLDANAATPVEEPGSMGTAVSRATATAANGRPFHKGRPRGRR